MINTIKMMIPKIVSIILLLVSFTSGECPPGGWWSDNEGKYCYHISEDRLDSGTSQEVSIICL